MSEPFSFLLPTALVAVAALPLILKVVPPNRLYGLRTSRTLSDRELWFRANQFTGWAVLLAAVVSAVIFLLAPQLASGRSLLGLLIFALPLSIALASSLAYVRKISVGDG